MQPCRKPKTNDRKPRKPRETQGPSPDLRGFCIKALTVRQNVGRKWGPRILHMHPMFLRIFGLPPTRAVPVPEARVQHPSTLSRELARAANQQASTVKLNRGVAQGGPRFLVYVRGARSGAGVEIGTRRSGLRGFGSKTCSLYTVSDPNSAVRGREAAT